MCESVPEPVERRERFEANAALRPDDVADRLPDLFSNRASPVKFLIPITLGDSIDKLPQVAFACRKPFLETFLDLFMGNDPTGFNIRVMFVIFCKLCSCKLFVERSL